MLRWSSTAAGAPADLDALADGSGDANLPFGAELVAFTEAIAGMDLDVIAAARERLAAASGRAFMIDAAAVVANFEMMTRVADGTGARFPEDPSGGRAELAASLGITHLVSSR